MDTGLLNLGEEHFSFNVFDEYECPDDSTCDTNRPYFSEWDDDDERELNGDIGLIPVASGFSGPVEDIASFTEAPPDIFERFGDWGSTYINIDVIDVNGLTTNTGVTEPLISESSSLPVDDHLQLNGNDLENFDLTQYMLNDDSPKKKPIKAPCKKIDLNAQKYIVDDNVVEPEKPADSVDAFDSSEDLIDVETVLDVNLPVLEASDPLGLLEQFEATETPILSCKDKKKDDKNEFTASFGFDNALLDMAVDKVSIPPVDIFENVKKEEEELKPVEKAKKPIEPPKRSSKPEKSFANNKQILNALPQELIARINESGKRKTITVIPPIPNKKRSASRCPDAAQPRTKIAKIAPVPPPAEPEPKAVKAAPAPILHNDHDYCSTLTPYPKEPQKDSGFQSSEDDDRAIIGNQPMVKNADGKLMVSLLKVNTIRNNTSKKKLNLEEYKKKRLIKLSTTSQSTSSSSSTCSSPLPEDENLKRIKHQEKLQKMALELLKTAPKSVAKKTETESATLSVYPKIPESYIDFPYVIVAPPGLEVREVVNCGTNTEVSNVNNKELLESLKQLEEIEPLLKKASEKITSNSFINSLIENIPKMRDASTKKQQKQEQVFVETESDRKVHYLPVHGPQVLTKSIEIQTDFDELIEDIQSRYRRRLEESSSSGSSIRSKSPVSVKSRPHNSPTYSTGSSSSSSYSRGRKSTKSRASRRSDSPYSQSSSSTRSRSRSNSRVRSRSRSRSFSPKRSKYNLEKLREVEERRVVYVGGILPGTSREELRRRFCRFGPITNISLHFRDYGDNYGFVTFANKLDAYRALEQGNSGGLQPKYDLSFGGRRIFCKTTYADLDNVRDEESSYYTGRSRSINDSFDDLLRECQERLKRKP